MLSKKKKKQAIEVDIEYITYTKLRRCKSILYIRYVDNRYVPYILKYP